MDPVEGSMKLQQAQTVTPSFFYKFAVVDPWDGAPSFNVVYQIWDTCGDERFADLAGLTGCMKSADAVGLVCDVTDRKSFEALSYHRQKFLNYRKLPSNYDFPMVVFANKSDCDDNKEVSEIELTNWCEDHLCMAGSGEPMYQRWARRTNNGRLDAFRATNVVDTLGNPPFSVESNFRTLTRLCFIRWASVDESDWVKKKPQEEINVVAQVAVQTTKETALLAVDAVDSANQAALQAVDAGAAGAHYTAASAGSASMRLTSLPAAGDAPLSAPRGEPPTSYRPS
jgi:GTPase SAR1 family protein